MEHSLKCKSNVRHRPQASHLPIWTVPDDRAACYPPIARGANSFHVVDDKPANHGYKHRKSDHHTDR